MYDESSIQSALTCVGFIRFQHDVSACNKLHAYDTCTNMLTRVRLISIPFALN